MAVAATLIAAAKPKVTALTFKFNSNFINPQKG
jgi:hypothetical protein